MVVDRTHIKVRDLMHHHKTRRIVEIEAEHGKRIDEVMSDYAKLYSFTFTMTLIGSCKSTFSEYRHLFKRNNQPPREVSPWVAQSNKNRAKRYDGMTLVEMSQKSGLHINTLRHRIVKLGWPVEKAMNVKPMPRGDVSRFGDKMKANRKKIKMR